MTLRNFLVGIFFLTLLIPFGARAATVRDSISHSLTRGQIQAKIQIILKQIAVLQAELNKVRARETPKLDTLTLNKRVQDSVVNILCQNNGGPFKSISGSGVIIDPRGVILTNAHIGEYFLVKDYPSPDSMRCVIRTGSPAQNSYYARLMFLPEKWILANRNVIGVSEAHGTGENDYSLLAISGSATGIPLPATFPFIPLDETIKTLPVDYSVLLTSYPGEFAGSFFIQNSLYESSSMTKVSGGYFFSGNPADELDMLDVSGTIISQGGSSGGAVVSGSTGKLIGIITTSSIASTTANRELRAITISHISRSLVSEGKGGLSTLLQNTPSTLAINFAANELPLLRALITQ